MLWMTTPAAACPLPCTAGPLLLVLHLHAGAPGAASLCDLAALEASEFRLVELADQEDAEETVAMANLGELWEQLMPHQREGVLAGVRRGGRLLLADEMGLGKTAQVGAATCRAQAQHNLNNLLHRRLWCSMQVHTHKQQRCSYMQAQVLRGAHLGPHRSTCQAHITCAPV